MKKYRYSQRKYNAAVKELAKQLVAWTQKEHPTLEDVDVANVADEYAKEAKLDIFEEILVVAGPRARATKKVS